MRVKELADILDIEYSGADFDIKSINTLMDAGEDEITFFDNIKYTKEIEKTTAGAVFIKEEFIKHLPKGSNALISENPYLNMAYASKFFKKPLVSDTKEPKIGENCTISSNVHIGNGSTIGNNVTLLANCVIGDNVVMGDNSVIYPNVTIYNDTKIGSDCFIQAGTVIGSDGFGYAHTDKGEHIKIYHNGNVILEDDVEIGANTTIDRAVFGSTIIKKGTKIDNLVQIAHNVEIGMCSIIVSQTGISGSTKLGRNVIMGGQSATVGHIEVGDFATIVARGAATKSIEGGKTYGGFPIMLHKDWLKQKAKISKIIKNL